MLPTLHIRPWATDMVRGIISLIFAIFFFTLQLRSLHVLTLLIGPYLIVDAGLRFFFVLTGRRPSLRKTADIVLDVGSVILGILCLVVPHVTLALFIYLVAVRILIKGVETLWQAGHDRGTVAGTSWLYGGAMIVGSLVLIAIPTLAQIVLVLILGGYALFDGIFMVARGLLMRFSPERYLALHPHETEHPADIPADLPPGTRRAIVFVRRKGASGLGHISWAFEWTNGWFNAGSVENFGGKPIARPEEMDFWSWHTLDPIGAMQRQPIPYDEYKVFYVTAPQPKTAWKTVVWESRTPYIVVRHNCVDVAYDVLRAHGVAELLDPAQEIAPNDWYDTLPGNSYRIADLPTIPLHLHRMSTRPLPTKEITLAIPAHVEGLAPTWRLHERRAWDELAQAWFKMNHDVQRLFTLRRQRAA
jgi:uncharacterized membrane protein HdeD (DUF308 family)